MLRRLLVSTFAFLLVTMGVATSACAGTGSPESAGRQDKVPAGPLVQLPEGTAGVEYGEITELSSDGKAQTITFKGTTGQTQGFGLRTYPNDEHLPLMSWVSRKWDPGRLLVLRPCRSLIGDCVVVVDSTTYQTNESPPQPDFPVLALVVVGDRVVVVDRLNGMPSGTPAIFNLLGVVRQ